MVAGAADHESFAPVCEAILHQCVIRVKVPVLLELETQDTPTVPSDSRETFACLQAPYLDGAVSRTGDDSRRIEFRTVDTIGPRQREDNTKLAGDAPVLVSFKPPHGWFPSSRVLFVLTNRVDVRIAVPSSIKLGPCPTDVVPI